MWTNGIKDLNKNSVLSHLKMWTNGSNKNSSVGDQQCFVKRWSRLALCRPREWLSHKIYPRYKSLSDHLIHPSEILMAVILFKGKISVNPLSHKNWQCQINGSKQDATAHSLKHGKLNGKIEIFSIKVVGNSCLQVGPLSTPVYFV